MAVTDLASLVDQFRREVGGDTSSLADDAVTGHIVDGFWDVRLDGMLGSYEVELDDSVSPWVATISPEISEELARLIVFYAGCRHIRNLIISQPQMFRAHTGPVEYETRYSTSALKDMLDSLEQRKRRLMVRLEADGFLGPTSVYMIDGVERNNYGELHLPERYP